MANLRLAFLSGWIAAGRHHTSRVSGSPSILHIIMHAVVMRMNNVSIAGSNVPTTRLDLVATFFWNLMYWVHSLT